MRKLFFLLSVSLCVASVASAQQSSLYVGTSPNFTQIQSGGSGTITLPSGGGTVITTLSSASITGSNIASGTITGSNIASGTITGSNVASSTITAANIADDGSTGSVLTSNGGTPHWVAASGGGVTPAYIFAYNAGATIASSFSAFTFPTVGSSSGITQSGASFIIGTTGVYIIQFSFYLGSSNTTVPDFLIQDNGTTIGGSEFESQSATQSINGSVIATLSSGDPITVKNNGGNVTLTSGSGSANTASIMITRIK